MKHIALSGTDGTVHGAAFMQTQDFVRAIGQNSGNLVFQYAVNRLIDADIAVIGRDLPRDPSIVGKQARALVIPSANFLREGLDFTGFVGFLQRTELPLVFLGLGAQAETVDTAKLDLHPSIERMIALMKERSKKVSVRGAFTAQVLERYGLDNVVVTGCPSNFINPAPDLADQIALKARRRGSSFITHAEEPWPKQPEKSEVERRLMDWTLKGRSIMIQQSVPAMIEYMRQDNPYAAQAPEEHFEDALQRQLMPDQSIEAFRDFAALRLRSYISVEQWMEDSARFDFSVGMRLHGNMAAWQTGTPALWIHHDARTQELVETMALPNLSVEDFLEHCRTMDDVRDRWEFDSDAYTARRRELRAAFDSVLKAHDIEPTA